MRGAGLQQDFHRDEAGEGGLAYISGKGSLSLYGRCPDAIDPIAIACVCAMYTRKGEIIPTCNFRPGAKRPYFEGGYYVGKSIYPAQLAECGMCIPKDGAPSVDRGDTSGWGRAMRLYRREGPFTASQ